MKIDEVLAKAMKKAGVKKENDLCKYLPMKTGGYMHHFTLRKMKIKQPQELAAIVEKFIVNADKLTSVAPKQRAPRGSRKRKEHMNFSRNQLDRMLSIARMAGDKEIVSMLSPRRSLATYKRELIQAIRQNRVEQELWNSYSEAVNAMNLLQQEPALAH